MSHRWLSRFAVAGLATLCLACQTEERGAESPPEAGSSAPNVRIFPAPMASVRGSTIDPPAEGELPASSASALRSAVVPPRSFPLHGDIGVERGPPRDSGLIELKGEFLWPDIEARSVLDKEREHLRVAHGRAARPLSTRPTLHLWASPLGHLTVKFESPVFSLPVGTELRARGDRWGHLVVWPDRRSYRLAPRGSLRALFNERRVDVVPLVTAPFEAEPAGRRLGFSTTHRVMEGPLGRVALKSATMPGSGEAGTLVCRLLLELGRLHASGELCPPDEVPLEAHYAWTGGGELTFRMASLQRHPSWLAVELPDLFDIPPPMPIFKPGELPPEPSPFLWPDETRAELWGDGDKAELLLANPAEVPMYVVVDRLPLARISALGTERWLTAKRVRTVGFRDFLGERTYPPRAVDVPGVLVLGPVPSPQEPVQEADPATADR